ncbi:hypothetical protein BDV38DRAFT_194983 [Aspergillus pseudotamarii]|uniref:Uncharacterized protein n=1 Tax=Aspergillus pseudotamarii TaxID=132259 RepID=A0A5N6SGM8_ASPPS|nr:uncharacterized protein BDV38DRAFT_194983 [Aspergillus pseudotamarii]KAE8133039.1 hypothetical protein BDV38DRAFT_194983 [Aspergillus pseudotamarii]
MTFQTTRPSPTLLIPSKRPLAVPKNPTLSLTTATYPPIHIRSTSTSTSTSAVSESKSKSKSTSTDHHVELTSRSTTVEYDFSSGPQPFLDPALWENVKAVDRLRREGDGLGEGDVSVKEKEEELRRKKEREAEYGGMAVRGRMGRWK